MQKRFSALVLFLLLAPILPAQNTPSLDALKHEGVEETDKLQTFTQQMVDQIFSYSELGFQEFETSRYVTGILAKNDFHVEHEIAGIPSARVASYGNSTPITAFV